MGMIEYNGKKVKTPFTFNGKTVESFIHNGKKVTMNGKKMVDITGDTKVSEAELFNKIDNENFIGDIKIISKVVNDVTGATKYVNGELKYINNSLWRLDTGHRVGEGTVTLKRHGASFKFEYFDVYRGEGNIFNNGFYFNPDNLSIITKRKEWVNI